MDYIQHSTHTHTHTRTFIARNAHACEHAHAHAQIGSRQAGLLYSVDKSTILG